MTETIILDFRMKDDKDRIVMTDNIANEAQSVVQSNAEITENGKIITDISQSTWDRNPISCRGI